MKTVEISSVRRHAYEWLTFAERNLKLNAKVRTRVQLVMCMFVHNVFNVLAK